MKAAYLVSSVLIATMAIPAAAREVTTTIDISTFHRNCTDMGGTYIRHTMTTATCVLPSGLMVYCDFSTGTCTVPRDVPKETKPLLGELGPGTVGPGPGGGQPKAVDGGTSTVN